MTVPLRVVSSADLDDESLVESAKRLTRLYCQECGFRPLPFMAREFVRYLKNGYEFELLEHVIGLTARAPRPSYAYFNAIMARNYGIKTMTDFLYHNRKPSPNDWSPFDDLDFEIRKELNSSD